MEIRNQNLHKCRFVYADDENDIHFCPPGMWAKLQTPENLKNSVLRDRDLTEKYEKGVILTNKIAKIAHNRPIWKNKIFRQNRPIPKQPFEPKADGQ